MLSWSLESIVSVTATLAGLAWAVYKFINERREERKWKQVEFLLELNQQFFNNPEIRECIQRMDTEHRHSELARIFQNGHISLKQDELQLLEKFQSLFQFLDSLHRCFEMKALTLDQIDLFGWCLYRINTIEFLRKYCREHGFGKVTILAEKLEQHAYARHK